MEYFYHRIPHFKPAITYLNHLGAAKQAAKMCNYLLHHAKNCGNFVSKQLQWVPAQ